MSIEQIPKTVLVLRQRLCEAGLESEVNDDAGAFARVIASSRGSGVYLCSGRRSMDSAGWILDALDMTGRLVVQQEDDDNLELVRECFNTDLRISVHAQNTNQFLDDVAKHRFELVVLDVESSQSPATIPRVASALSEGGVLLLLGESGLERVLPPTDFVISSLSNIGRVVARRRSSSRPRRRSGGRSKLKTDRRTAGD